MAKRIWNISLTAVTVIVRAPKSQDKPKRNMIPAMLTINLSAVLVFKDSFVRANFSRVCLITMNMMMMYITTLSKIIMSIGPKNAAQKTAGLSRKQLQKNDMQYSGQKKMFTCYNTVNTGERACIIE